MLLISNHLSYLDVFFLGIPLRRPLNYVARSTLFLPVLGSTDAVGRRRSRSSARAWAHRA